MQILNLILLSYTTNAIRDYDGTDSYIPISFLFGMLILQLTKYNLKY